MLDLLLVLNIQGTPLEVFLFISVLEATFIVCFCIICLRQMPYLALKNLQNADCFWRCYGSCFNLAIVINNMLFLSQIKQKKSWLLTSPNGKGLTALRADFAKWRMPCALFQLEEGYVREGMGK